MKSCSVVISLDLYNCLLGNSCFSIGRILIVMLEELVGVATCITCYVMHAFYSTSSSVYMEYIATVDEPGTL